MSRTQNNSSLLESLSSHELFRVESKLTNSLYGLSVFECEKELKEGSSQDVTAAPSDIPFQSPSEDPMDQANTFSKRARALCGRAVKLSREQDELFEDVDKATVLVGDLYSFKKVTADLDGPRKAHAKKARNQEKNRRASQAYRERKRATICTTIASSLVHLSPPQVLVLEQDCQSASSFSGAPFSPAPLAPPLVPAAPSYDSDATAQPSFPTCDALRPYSYQDD
jgi:hypothetical protein